MKCYKCGKEGTLRKGLCVNCYRDFVNNKYLKRKKRPTKSNFILNNIDRNEKILNKIETSKLIYLIILIIISISIILLPKTFIEFCINNKKFYFILLVLNVLLFFSGIYLILYFTSRDIYLTDKKIIGKWGLFKIKKINIPLNNIISIDTYRFTGLELDTNNKNLFFDFVKNNENFKFSTFEQIKNIIDSANDETILTNFSHSIKEQLDKFQLESTNPNMIICNCCKKLISKDSVFCVHCGNPIYENERSADIFIKTICFIIPPIGIILFLLNIGPFPKFAKQCLLSSVSSLFIILVGYLSLLSIL